MTNFQAHLEILNPNSCGQGYCPHHNQNPNHDVLMEHGWEYSHTTPITLLGGEKVAHHTYKFPGTDWSIGVRCSPGWPTYSSHKGVTTGTHFHHGLKKYLKRKTRELRKGT